jgi:tripartite-type tricarboxylate transporter receptor subunit TctC
MVRKTLQALAFVGAALIAAAPAAAQTASPGAAPGWPDKPIRLVVAYPAGGGVDIVARTVGQRLAEVLKQQVVIENRTGASGTIGADFVAKSPPDGYTFLLASPAEVLVGPIAGQKTAYNPETDLVPVALAGETPLVIISHPSVPAKDLKDLVDYAKKNPGKLSYGTPGNGSSMHFAGEALKAQTGAAFAHVPYRGAAPALNDVLGNQVPVGIMGMPPVVAHAKAGRVNIVAVTTSQRSSVFPNVPSVAEMPGLKDYRFTNWMAVFAPAKTPQAIVERFGAEVAKAVKEPAVRDKLLAAGVEPMGIAGAELSAWLGEERKRYKDVASSRGIKFEE